MHFHDVEKRKTRRLLPVFSTLPTRSPIFFLMLIELFPPISLIFISLICSQGFLFPCGHRNSLKTLTNERCSPLFDFYVSKSEMRNLTASAFCVHRRSLVASWSYVKWKVVVTSNPEFVCSKLSTCFTTNMNNHILTPLKNTSSSLCHTQTLAVLTWICSDTRKTYQQTMEMVFPLTDFFP